MPETTVRSELDTQVRDIMRPGVIAVPEDASLLQVQRTMTSHPVHAVLVVGARHGAPLGWISSRGMLAWAYHDAALTPASAAITGRAITIEPSATAREALQRLAETGASHLLVTAGLGLVPEGVVGELDIVRLLAG